VSTSVPTVEGTRPMSEEYENMDEENQVELRKKQEKLSKMMDEIECE